MRDFFIIILALFLAFGYAVLDQKNTHIIKLEDQIISLNIEVDLAEKEIITLNEQLFPIVTKKIVFYKYK